MSNEGRFRAVRTVWASSDSRTVSARCRANWLWAGVAGALLVVGCAPTSSGVSRGGSGGNGSGGHGASGGNSGTGGASVAASGGQTASSGGNSGSGGAVSATGGAAGQVGATGGDAPDAAVLDAQSGDGTAGGGAGGPDGGAPDSVVAGASGRGGGAAAAAAGATGAAGAGGAAADPLEVDVYLLGGQSNATGQGYIKNYPPGLVPNPAVHIYHSGAPHLDSGAAANSWIPLRQASESPDRYGPEIGFGNEIQKLYPARKIYIIKHAHSGTSLFQDWVPGATSSDSGAFGPQFTVFVTTVNGGLKGLRDQGLHPVIRGMLWQQGEADADAGGTTAQQYGQNLKAFIARVRQQWSSPTMLFIYGYVYPPPNTGAGRDAVRLAERNLDQDSGNALAVSRAFVVETDDLSQRANDPGTPLPSDHIHFGSAGQLELGKRMADKVRDHWLLP
ncbi:MAG: sialate O-acetylesterase [Polyangia bacterium]